MMKEWDKKRRRRKSVPQDNNLGNCFQQKRERERELELELENLILQGLEREEKEEEKKCSTGQ